MPSVAEYLADRLERAGVRHVFGVPGEYISHFFDTLATHNKLSLVTTAGEDGAAYAADAYARVNGIGCVCTTYSVGAFKALNAVAGAYAERSPLIVISGAPGMKERQEPIIHHMMRSFKCQKEVFGCVTCAATVLEDHAHAGFEIDRMFESLDYYKQPVYIELPTDVAQKSIAYDVYRGQPLVPQSDPENLQEALAEVVARVCSAKHPVILAGSEIARFGLQEKLQKFAEKTNIPVAVTLLSKSVIQENHPLFLGLYSGSSSQEGVQQAVETSDCLLIFGVMVGDHALSSLPAKFKKRDAISCTVDEMSVSNHRFEQVCFKDFLQALFRAELPKREQRVLVRCVELRPYTTNHSAQITVNRFFQKLNSILDERMCVLADSGDSLYGASDLVIHDKFGFLGSALYTSMGCAIPGAVGVSMAKPGVRPVVVVGDGAFQMSANEIGTIAARKIPAIIFVLNNHGYATERLVHNGSYNNVPEWKYESIHTLFGTGTGVHVKTEEQLDAAIAEALNSKTFCVVHVDLAHGDVSSALKRKVR